MFIIIDGRPAFWYRGTGIGNYTYELIENLSSIDSNNKYFILIPENQKWRNSNEKFIFYPLSINEEANFWEKCLLGQINIEYPVDVYHIPQNGIGIPLNGISNQIITLHDIIPFKIPETCNPKYLNIFTKTLPEVIKKSKCVITVSEFSKKDIVEYFNIPEDTVHVTKLAAEKIYFPLNKKLAKKFMKNNYGIEDEYILYVGGLGKRKNIIALINAFEKLLKTSKKKLKLVIIGKKSFYYPTLMERVSELKIENDVLFPGFIPLEYMPYFYSSAICFCYPSLYEGFGLPPVEAMACGTAVISSYATSLPEVLENAALYFDPYDEDDILRCLNKIINDDLLREELIKIGLTLTKKLTWENTARSTLKVYESFI
ncbi:MAG: glycosyltransferase family 4 protein [Oscillospiraceae bacterium]|nr:glycosyltransferase family 4 protein [Oscillospiraceae bacterium]